jgi:hypothetical protein
MCRAVLRNTFCRTLWLQITVLGAWLYVSILWPSEHIVTRFLKLFLLEEGIWEKLTWNRTHACNRKINFSAVKQPGREADQLPPSSAEVKKTCIYTSASPLSLHGVVTLPLSLRRTVSRAENVQYGFGNFFLSVLLIGFYTWRAGHLWPSAHNFYGSGHKRAAPTLRPFLGNFLRGVHEIAIIICRYSSKVKVKLSP